MSWATPPSALPADERRPGVDSARPGPGPTPRPTLHRRSHPVVQARRIQPAAGPLDRRRLAAAGLSALLPGLGQALNRRPRLALVFLIPSLIVIGVGVLLWVTQSPTSLAARAVAPAVMGTLLTLNLLLLIWRLLAMFQAFLDTRLHGPTSKVGVIGMVVLSVLVVLPHAFV